MRQQGEVCGLPQVFHLHGSLRGKMFGMIVTTYVHPVANVHALTLNVSYKATYLFIKYLKNKNKKGNDSIVKINMQTYSRHKLTKQE